VSDNVEKRFETDYSYYIGDVVGGDWFSGKVSEPVRLKNLKREYEFGGVPQ
jgi:hypothetical protein